MKSNAGWKKELCVAALVLALIALVFATGALDRQRVWEDLPHREMRFPNGLTRDIQAGDAYGVMSEGPGLTLPAGTYRLKWRAECDGDNRMIITSENDAVAVPGEVTIHANGWDDEIYFTLESAAERLEIQVMFESGTYLNIWDIRLYSPMYCDHAFTFAFAAAALYALWLLHRRGHLTPERRGRLILIGLAVLIASAPSLKQTVSLGHDSRFHLMRLCNLADGLAQGQFPARIGGYSYNGYGAITSAFYPDVFLYIPALMMNAGATLQYAANVLFAAVNIASALTMYAAARRIFRESWTATCASILYTLSIYRITDVYSRYAVGEMLAMVFLPLFLLGLYEVIWGEKRRWPLLCASAACIFLSHLLSTLICAVSAVAVCAPCIVKIVRERRLGAIVKAGALTAVLCLFQLVPFFLYSMQGIGAQDLVGTPIDWGSIAPAQLLLMGEGNSTVPADEDLTYFSLEIGFPLLLAAALALYAAATAHERTRDHRTAVILVLAGALCAWMTTTFFPWHYVRVLTHNLCDYLQFPWRLLMITSLCFALAGGYGCVRFARGHGEQAAALMLALAALCALPTLSGETRNDSYIPYGETVSSRQLYYTEYLLPDTDIEQIADVGVHTGGDVSLTGYHKLSTTVTAQVEARTDATVSLPLFGFDGYRATVDGQEMAVSLGENNRLTVSLPAGTSGALRVWFAGKGIWRVSDAVSLAALVACLACGLRRACMKRKKERA